MNMNDLNQMTLDEIERNYYENNTSLIINDGKIIKTEVN